MTAAIATPEDLGRYLDLPEVDEDRAILLIQLAQDKCTAVVSPLPDEARGVVLDVAARAYINPGMVQQQAIGSVSVSYGTPTGGLWLTKANIADLRRLSGRTGAFTIDTMPATAGTSLPWWDNGLYGYPDAGWNGWA